MSHTRPIEDPIEIDPYRPPAPLKVEGDGNSVKSEINNDHSVNKHLPYIWFNGVISAFSFGLGVCGIILVIMLSLRANVNENHWRSLETDYKTLELRVEQLEKDHAKRSQ